MQFETLEFAGTFLLVPEPRRDERGFFARTFCADEFRDHDLVCQFAQSSISVNTRRGTVRGMHFSVAPQGETKIVRCTAGAIHDVLVDIRPDSSTYLRSVSLTLSAENRLALYVPVGIAHGFQTLRHDTEVFYMIDVPYAAESARGLRWNDPAIEVKWPEPISMISDRDLAYLDWITPESGPR
jgi:dTDP-4-dehydrorhamnose 3,5-epimerase